MTQRLLQDRHWPRSRHRDAEQTVHPDCPSFALEPGIQEGDFLRVSATLWPIMEGMALISERAKSRLADALARLRLESGMDGKTDGGREGGRRRP